MAIKTKEEVLSSLKDYFGEETSDAVLSIVEDVTDTLDDLMAKASDSTDWKQKYEENDASWRQKYKDRFFNTDDSYQKEDEEEYEEEDTREVKSFEDLFEIKED